MMMVPPFLDSQTLLDRARLDRFLPEQLAPMTGPDFDFGFNQANIDALLDRENWKRKPPRIHLWADWTGRGNIRVYWTPEDEADFVRMPDIELARFTGLKAAVNHAQLDNRAAYYIVYAHMARYDELVRGLRAHVEVMSASRIVPLWQFDVDIEGRPSRVLRGKPSS